MFGMFKKKEPPRELTPEEQSAKAEYDRTYHGEAANIAAAKLSGICNLDKTFRTFGPELSAKIDAIPETLSALQFRAMYNECNEHFEALQKRYNKLQEEYAKVSRECGQLETELKMYKK